MPEGVPIPPPPRGPRPSWARGCLILAGLGLIFSVLMLLLAGMIGAPSRRAGGFSLGARVGLITLEGDIEDSRDFREELDRLREDPRVKALVLRIDSPGGGVAATQEIRDAILRYRVRTGHPVVASLGALAASGGYYVACAAPHIMAEPGTLTGSIGVIFSFTDASELLRKIGIHVDVVKSGEKKDFGAYWRPLSPEEREMLQGIVGDVYGQFTEAVAESREMSLERVRELADGRILSGRQARTAGLVDSLGYTEDAVRLAATLAGLDPETPTLSKQRFEPALFDLVRHLVGRTNSWLGARPRLEYR